MRQQIWTVLILVVMEDGLVLFACSNGIEFFSDVLILVVMEDGLVRTINVTRILSQAVLILVVVEDGLVPDFMLKFHNDLRS